MQVTKDTKLVFVVHRKLKRRVFSSYLLLSLEMTRRSRRIAASLSVVPVMATTFWKAF